MAGRREGTFWLSLILGVVAVGGEVREYAKSLEQPDKRVFFYVVVASIVNTLLDNFLLLLM